jgi:aldehyde dehydrogenase (NAD+)
MLNSTKIYIDGEWIQPADAETIEIINPATEEVVGNVSLASAGAVDLAVSAARKAFRTFAKSSRQERLDLLGSVLSVYERRWQDLADALVEELGAPAKFAREMQVGVGYQHLQTGLQVLKTYAFEHPQGPRTIVRREPIGVIGLITPWNWPINQITCKVVPALATGNTMVHKPSEVTPFTAQIIAEILDEAGTPKGVYNLVTGTGPVVGAAISSHPRIDMVSFTGSTRAGVDVAKRAAENVKRVHQELGGKSPNIVLDDADFGRAVTENVFRLMLNSGQSCHAPTRLLVPVARMDEVKAIAAQAVAAITVGDPTTDVYMGPVVSKKQWDTIQSYIRTGLNEGATLVAGGEGRPQDLNRGYYVRPTVFAEVNNQMTIAREEIFGPVLCVIGYRDIEDAVAIANDTIYGLAAYVQSANEDRAKEVAAQIEAGVVFINRAGEDPNAPFGGYKMSGNGREWGEIAFGDFLEIKAVVHREAA